MNIILSIRSLGAILITVIMVGSVMTAEARTAIPEDQQPDACATDNGDRECRRWYQVGKKKKLLVLGINFATGSANITPGSRRILKDNLPALEHSRGRIKITGYTDNQGSPESNLKLSAARANSVKTYFASKGIDAKRMKTNGKGESNPVASNDTYSGRAQNRRIEIKLN